MQIKNKKNVVIIVSILFLAAIGSLVAYNLSNKKSIDQAQTNSDDSLEIREQTNPALNYIVPDNSVLAGSDWYNVDNAPLVFVDGEHWVWYQTNEKNSGNSISGTYETYYGNDAYNAIDSNYFVDEGDRPQSDEYSIVLKLNVLSIQDDNEEVLENSNIKTMMGSLSAETLSLMDLDSLMNYTFSAEPNPEKDENDKINIEDVIKDITYAENTDAWMTFEIKVNGINLAYPYSANDLNKAGLTYIDIDENNGSTKFLLNGNLANVTGIFSNKKTDQLNYLELNNTEGLDVVLANGITWGSSLEDIISAYGEPDEILTGSVNETIYQYNCDKGQMELTVFTEDSLYGNNAGLTRISIHEIYNE